MTLDGFYLIPVSIKVAEGIPAVVYDPLNNGDQPVLKVDLQDNPQDSYDQLQYRIEIDPSANLTALEWRFELASNEVDLSEYITLYRIVKGEAVPVEGLVIPTQQVAVEGVTSLEINLGLARKGGAGNMAFTLNNQFLTLTPITGQGDQNHGLGDPTDHGVPPGGIIRF